MVFFCPFLVEAKIFSGKIRTVCSTTLRLFREELLEIALHIASFLSEVTN